MPSHTLGMQLACSHISSDFIVFVASKHSIAKYKMGFVETFTRIDTYFLSELLTLIVSLVLHQQTHRCMSACI
jgi:hypothetical protein